MLAGDARLGRGQQLRRDRRGRAPDPPGDPPRSQGPARRAAAGHRLRGRGRARAAGRHARGRWPVGQCRASSIPRAWNVPASPAAHASADATPAPSSRCRTAATTPAPSASSRRAAGRAARCRSPTCCAEVARHLDAGAREVVLTGRRPDRAGATTCPAPRASARWSRRSCATVPALQRLRLSSLDGVEIDRRAVRTARRRAAGHAARPPLAAVGRRPDPQADEAPPFARAMPFGWSNGCARAAPTSRSAPT